ncbi:NB-ARC domain-containing protein [Corchorus olitorius]|uniref:NB-ARC domain-containing protein n=1 Tax=Corchorus olitorius TaxID=93759 RepID=A0A1R3H7H3_9ROSI|nr:NB-ARC domain-containing protein [Corchorus olitorius]
MADAIVSAVLQQLLTIVDREAEQEVRLVVGVKKEVEKMRTTFQTIQAVLVDAEKRQFKEEAVRVWLGKLKHIYYDIDDVLDEWNTAILKSQIEGRHQTPSTDSSPLSQVYSCIPSPCSCFGGLALRRDIGVKIRELNERLQAISKEKDDFAFLVNTSDNDLESERPPKTTHFVDVSEIRGRDQDRDTVISIKILVTTRKADVATIMGCTQLLHLEKLSPDECWFLFSGIAFSGRAESDRDECRVMLASNAMEESTTDFYDENVRHLTSMRDRLEIPDPTYNLKKLRTLFLDEFLSFPGDKEILDVCLLKLFDQSTCLRVLYLRSKLIEKVPQEIGKLIHLRYLSLDECTGLRELPEALCDLCNLQTLNIKMCFGLESLPRGMEKLINLRHLGNGGTCGIRFMPEGMGRLTSLQTLDEFVVNESETDSCRLEDLGKFIHLRGHLTIRRLGNYAGEGGSEARLSTKLRSLGLDFNGGYDKEAQKAIEDEASLMQALEPPQHLRSLQIEYCKGIVFPFPNWMTLLTSLKSVTLIHCWNWESLPPMGKLRFLESLSIWDMRKVKKVGEEFLGVETKDGQTSTNNNIVAYFPNLKKLEFKGMHEWEEWEYELRNRGGDESCSSSSSTIPTIIMPKLQCLDIEGCPKLKKLPRHILQSRALQQLKIPYCDILYKRYDKEAGDDWPSISHIPQAMPQLTDRSKLPSIVDPVIRDTMDLKHLYQVAAVAVLCIQPEPSYRPLITDVLHSLIPLVPTELGGSLRVA